MFVKGIPNSTHTFTAYALPKVLPFSSIYSWAKGEEALHQNFYIGELSKVFFLGVPFEMGQSKLLIATSKTQEKKGKKKKRRKENLGEMRPHLIIHRRNKKYP